MKTKISPQKRLKAYLISEKQAIWMIVVYGAFTGLFSLIVPIAVQSLVNTISFGSVLQPLFVLTLIVFVILSFSGIMGILQNIAVEVLQQRIFARISTELAYRLPRVQVQSYDEKNITELVNRFFDVLVAQKSAAVLLVDGIAVILQTAVGMALLAFYHPLLLAFDLLLLLGLYLIFVQFGRNGVSTSIHESHKKYAMAAWLEDLAKNPITFRSKHGNSFALEKADELATDYVKARKAHFRVLLRQIIGAVSIQTGASALLLGLGGWLVIQRQLTLGQLVASELVVSAVTTGFSKFGKYLETYYDLTAAADKLGYLYDLPIEKDEGEPFPQWREVPVLEFKNVSYSGSQQKVTLSGLQFTLKAGEKVALTSQASKALSWISEMAFGLRGPTEGQVQINGVDLREIRLEDLRSQISLVRSIEFFHGTILENIRLQREDLDLVQIRDVLEQLGLLEELSNLPDGLNTTLIHDQSSLSVSQAYRLMLARALVGNPRLVILDQTLDYLDPESLKKVNRTLFHPKAPYSVLVITHSAEVMARCSSVYTLNEEGTLTRHKKTEL
ncbi:MAG: ATP-binding cassette domain-containing protein [Bdellovibrionia bacterium]